MNQLNLNTRLDSIIKQIKLKYNNVLVNKLTQEYNIIHMYKCLK